MPAGELVHDPFNFLSVQLPGGFATRGQQQESWAMRIRGHRGTSNHNSSSSRGALVMVTITTSGTEAPQHQSSSRRMLPRHTMTISPMVMALPLLFQLLQLLPPIGL